MQDPNTINQEDVILKLDQDRAWLLENLDRGNGLKLGVNLLSLKGK